MKAVDIIERLSKAVLVVALLGLFNITPVLIGGLLRIIPRELMGVLIPWLIGPALIAGMLLTAAVGVAALFMED